MLQLRPITPADNPIVARIVRTVMPEFNCVGEGFSINDPELADMYAAYSAPRSAYYMLTQDGRPVGVGGYAPLAGGDGTVCELRKMYLLPESRGLGGGRMLLEKCLQAAEADGYERMYLETVRAMTAAVRLYASYGFTPLAAPLGNTGHSGCDRFMIRSFR
ncbi:putative acetyltransferase [Lewinella marina]|uniref:GNAT family N-acetyltransferase n=1 Tax=Neolewinella marina TaxID=438751 RepID=A0A2G0CJY7_9BACT|nr:GNAT family N-acetyltransferase [Neolewinella marina]NJB84528.1 putative acetyltransferase [Neolewinella marina]PHL00287.1 GNAT family N-acetyltransferase [Neolewinella marina]